MNPRAKLAGLALATFCASPAPAVCLVDDYSVPAEFTRSSFVVLGTVASEEPISDAKGPDGIGGIRYVVKIKHIFRGRTDSPIYLFSENSSGRFPMRVGTEYILFVGVDGAVLSVDNCGNSTDVEHGHRVIDAVEKLSANAGT